MARKRNNGQVFAENPFLRAVAEHTRIGKKTITTGTNDKFLLINKGTGEALPTGIYTHQEVELNEFVKLYAEGAAAILGLKTAGRKAFQIFYSRLLGKEGKDKTEIWLNYETFDETIKKWISRATWDRGINELIKAQFIAQSPTPGYYFVNPCYIYNGNRLLIAKAYTLKPQKPAAALPSKSEYTEDDQIPLPFDEKPEQTQ